MQSGCLFKSINVVFLDSCSGTGSHFCVDVGILPGYLHVWRESSTFWLRKFPGCFGLGCSAVFNVKTLSRWFLATEQGSRLINNASSREHRFLQEWAFISKWSQCNLFYHQLHLSHLEQEREVTGRQGKVKCSTIPEVMLQTSIASIHSSKLIIWRNKEAANIDRIDWKQQQGWVLIGWICSANNLLQGHRSVYLPAIHHCS